MMPCLVGGSQAIAVKAVALLSNWGFENTDLVRLEIVCAAKNLRNQRVAEKAGALKEEIRESCLELHGKKHDAVVFSIQRGRAPNKTNETDSWGLR